MAEGIYIQRIELLRLHVPRALVKLLIRETLLMQAKWNHEKKHYELVLSEKELGINIFALTCAKYETKDAAVAALQKEFLDLNNAGVVDPVLNIVHSYSLDRQYTHCGMDVSGSLGRMSVTDDSRQVNCPACIDRRER
jgi:hypothetical protein